MNDDKKLVELEPHEWKSAGRKNEPFFGPGIWVGVAWLIGFSAISLTLHYFR